ncbi:MAG: RpiB/LacA/LacB family sugar-phosphate isomerase [bacterium]
MAKEHNNANMISLGQRMMSLKTAFRIINTWLSAQFQGGRHLKRINKIEEA